MSGGRDQLIQRVAAAMEAASEKTILVDFDVMSGEMVVDWEALAEAAFDVMCQEWSPPF